MCFLFCCSVLPEHPTASDITIQKINWHGRLQHQYKSITNSRTIARVQIKLLTIETYYILCVKTRAPATIWFIYCTLNCTTIRSYNFLPWIKFVSALRMHKFWAINQNYTLLSDKITQTEGNEILINLAPRRS